ncbi:hypothetical protein [Rubrivirga sp. IMCC43871]|uniref:hypothetical protein n=1 Tax=Rubrivirga sp. IMCC43871 TaxID=3391575 RepID=UPI00398FFD5B
MPETDAEITARCLKCGSDAMVPGVRVVDRGQNNHRHDSELGLQVRPDAVIFKREVRVGTWSQVCGDCGFVELYADDPAALWDAHIDRLANDLD